MEDILWCKNVLVNIRPKDLEWICGMYNWNSCEDAHGWAFCKESSLGCCQNHCTTASCTSVVYRGGVVWGVQTPPKFLSFDKAELNSQFHGKYIRNNLTRIRLPLIFWVVSWNPPPASYDPHSGIFISLQGMTWRKHKVPKIKKILPYEMKFLVKKLQLPPETLTRGLPPPDTRSLCPLSSTEFVEPPYPSPPEQNSWVRHCDRA